MVQLNRLLAETSCLGKAPPHNPVNDMSDPTVSIKGEFLE